MYLSRNEIISEAIYKCYKEMYKMAQPSVDFDQIIEDIKSLPVFLSTQTLSEQIKSPTFKGNTLTIAPRSSK